MPPRTAHGLARDEGPVHNLGVDFVLKVSELSSGAGAAVAEYVTRKGEEPGGHVHEHEDEMFYVVEGRVAFYCGSSRYEVGEGGFVFLPQGIEHGYDILSDGDVRLLVITAPPRPTSGGWAGFLGDVEGR
ncbi:MAG: cupin domain-containing protein [Candidatus Dormibacteraeota bacterium]|nr:cupin domain-containing protein [Candidatus Dormibacteraeota bacterium]